MVKSNEPKPDTDKQKNTLDIGLLEEDDEFEEFPVEGKSSLFLVVNLFGKFYMCLFYIKNGPAMTKRIKKLMFGKIIGMMIMSRMTSVFN
jgi:hypothetical protein